jgi:hypothetical protein
MKDVWGRSPELPREVMLGAAERARRLGRRVVGDDLFLLALSELPGDPPARRALEAEGIDSNRILGQVRAHGDSASEGNVRLTFARRSTRSRVGRKDSRLSWVTARSLLSTSWSP